jgi:hypothetical protein
MRAALVLVVLLAAPAPAPAPAHADCLTYAGPVELAGVLARRTFAGPPNYESVARGDRPETMWLLRLDQPACVAADARDATGFNVAVASVREIQLVVTPEQYQRYRDRVGRRVALSGTLFGAETGHHHTPVLLGDVQFR